MLKGAYKMIQGQRLIIWLLCVWLLFGMQLSLAAKHPDIESRIFAVVDLLQQKQTGKAIEELDSIISLYPKYDLPRLMKADLLAAISGRKSSLSKKEQKQLAAIRKELIARWQSRQADETLNIVNKLPLEAVYLDAYYQYFIVVDVKKYRMYLFANEGQDKIKLLQTSYITIGARGYGKEKEGDRKTPLGTYFINGIIDGTSLDPFRFGIADALPIDYPNSIDKQLGRTGYGIWLHGTPQTDEFRPPEASNGCISLNTEEMQQLVEMLKNKTVPILIADQLQWAEKDVWLEQRKQFFLLLADWKRAQEKRDEKVLSELYDGNIIYNRKSHSGYGYPSVQLDKIAVMYNRHDNLMLTAFEWREENGMTAFKNIYWTPYGGGWRIVNETTKPIPVISKQQNLATKS